MLGVGALLRRPVALVAGHRAALTRAGSYGTGSTAAFWVIERNSRF